MNAICCLLHLILGVLSATCNPHLVSSTREDLQKQGHLEKWKQEMKIMESERMTGEQGNSV